LGCKNIKIISKLQLLLAFLFVICSEVPIFNNRQLKQLPCDYHRAIIAFKVSSENL